MAATADGPAAGDGASGSGPLGDDERAELTALRARLAGTRSRHRVRSFFSALLITLAAVLAPLGAVAVWAADIVGDTDRYVATMAPLADNPQVRRAVTDQVTSAVMDRIDLDSLLSSVAPSDLPGVKAALGGISGPITSGVTDFVHGTVATFVSSSAFSTIWEELNRRAHATVVDALTGSNDSAVQVEHNTVTLDLAPVVAGVKQQLVDRGLKVAGRLPDVHTDFTLLKSDEIGRVKTGFRALQLAGDWLPVVTVVVAGAGVLLAVRRRRALVAAALGVAAGVAVLGVALALFRTFYLDHLSPDVHHAAAAAIYDQVVRFLRASVRMVITLGVVVALGAWLSGSGQWAVRVRTMWESGIAAVREAAGVRSTGPVGPWVDRFRVWLRWVVVAVASVVLALWPYPTGMVIFWIALVTVAGLAVIEFLDERPAVDTTGGGERGSGALTS
ncbi:hypothetical protein ACIOC1_31555 [Streptomyces sp. NPDC088197]|uniref:hypothetical protein n=1 Tax=Streptomyces sp. NPDC088197 TaxID=3365840 RepID=UPI00380CD274